MSPKKKSMAARAKAPAKKAAKKSKPVDDDDDEDEEEEEPKAKKGKTKAAPKASKNGKVDWQAMLDNLESGGLTGNIFFPKSGKTRVKLVLEDEEDEESWYTEVQGEFEGRVRSRYIVRGIVMFPAQDEKKIMGIVVSKTAMKGIVGMLAEKYDLFDPEEGHGITISKTGASLNTTWGVTPSPKPVEVEDFEEYDEDGASLEELEKQLEEIGANRTKKKGKKSSDDDEDEDDEEEDW